ncbi:6-phosphogluconolactonase, cycloisomerase 2 family [Streptomyces sp. DvalAA-14]|uniref:lactonase family protein n=1 Tax=unclassified Streptomyces TaxID=2593676 RepID=UPI00081B6535|nr:MULTISPECIES: beta-propeller fold lactonase family protein [unclassified Streptomyces]MYS19273.1 beta-propeller fold lactonase family protein [Streptomyces sp. SID4948]SCD40852.1 6-phosphogluconolactonase, cycloisomerase 2 family [Streptomyces sp. DvalAA-14]
MKRVPTLSRIAKSAIAVAASMAAFAIPAASAAASPAPRPGPAGPDGPVFVQTDNTAGNTIVAYRRAADGSLHRQGTFATGGKGGILDGSVVDHLASQHSLTYDFDHHLLFAVNAGSNTVTVFSVDGDRLHREQVITSGGTFPVSVTVHKDAVYVLNARDGGSIQGYRITGNERLQRIADRNRKLHLDTTTAPEFTHTPAQVSFTPDGSQLVVTTKLGGSSIEVFGLNASGAPSGRHTVTTEAGRQPFGFTFDAQGRLVVTDGVNNAVLTFRLRRDGRLVQLDDAPTGQMATCWVVRAGQYFYASNAGSNTLSGFRQTRRATLVPLGNTPTGTGTVDAAVTPDAHFLYVQTGGVGAVDAFRIGANGSLTPVGTVTVPNAVGGEGIVAL